MYGAGSTESRAMSRARNREQSNVRSWEHREQSNVRSQEQRAEQCKEPEAERRAM